MRPADFAGAANVRALGVNASIVSRLTDTNLVPSLWSVSRCAIAASSNSSWSEDIVRTINERRARTHGKVVRRATDTINV